MRKKKETPDETPKSVPAGEYMDVAAIAHAPWNPRTPEELKPEHPAMAELIASVKALGVIQPIAVWNGLCIAGNRRLEAAKIAGRAAIPVIRFTDIDEATARAITRAENEVRFGVSPLLDARLVGELKSAGKSQAEIAALLGTSEAKICRRAKLLDLIPEAVERLGAMDAEARALEIYAAYPPEVQRKALKDMAGARLTVSQVKTAFAHLTCPLDALKWVFEMEGGAEQLNRCLMCERCTGAQPDLFDIAPNPDAPAPEKGSIYLARCLDAKCYKRLEESAKAVKLFEAVRESGGTDGDAADAKDVKRSWKFPAGTVGRKSKKNPAAYVCWSDWDHKWKVKWGPDPKAAKAKEERRKEDEAAADAERERREAVLDSAVAKCMKFLRGDKTGKEDEDEVVSHIEGVLACVGAADVRHELAVRLYDETDPDGWNDGPRIAAAKFLTDQIRPGEIGLTADERDALEGKQ